MEIKFWLIETISYHARIFNVVTWTVTVYYCHCCLKHPERREMIDLKCTSKVDTVFLCKYLA